MNQENTSVQNSNQSEPKETQSQASSSTTTETSSKKKDQSTTTPTDLTKGMNKTTISMQTPTKFQMNDRLDDHQEKLMFLFEHLNLQEKWNELTLSNKVTLEEQVKALQVKYGVMDIDKDDQSKWIDAQLSEQDMLVIDKYLSSK